ncbi:MAG TPA: PTS sugar transporter subunit IIC [Elusimicrobiales bacterium]|nr:PTS sugar transporter subunit IIC [Elusimicrobiales bacterium]
MTTVLRTLLSSALAGLLGLDAVAAGQFLFSRPAFVGPLLGWLNGCPLEGARLGILLEMLYIDIIPVGGVVPPNGTAAAAVGVLAHSAAGLAPSLAFFIGAGAGAAYSPVESWLRTSRSAWNPLILGQVAAGDLNISRWVARALLMENAALAGYCACWVALAAALAAAPGVLALYPGTDFAYSLMPWLGLSGLYFRFRTQAHKK